MNNFAGIFGFSLLIEIVLIFFCFLIGHIFLSIFKKEQDERFYRRIFFKLLTGVTVLVATIALVRTAGRTIMIFIPVIFILWLIENKAKAKNFSVRSISFQIKIDLRELLIFIPVLILFCWQAVFVLQGGAVPLRAVEKDVLFYSEISKCLIETGTENNLTTPVLANEIYNFQAPYHYFDLWLSGFIARFTGLFYPLCLPLIVYTFFTSLLFLGFLSFFEKFRKPSASDFLLSGLLLFVGGLHINNKIQGINNYCSEMENIMEVFGGKLAAMYAFVLASILLFLEEKRSSSIFLILCIPAISISTCPGIISGLLTFIAWQFFKKEADKKEVGRILMYTLAIGAGYIGFYGIFNASDLNYRIDKPLMQLTDMNDFTLFRLKFYLYELWLKTWAQPFIFALNYLPFILPVFLIWKIADRNMRSLMWLLTLIWFFSLIAFNTFYLMEDAQQLFTNNLVFCSVFFIYCFIFIQNEPSKVNPGTKKILLAVCTVALLYSLAGSFLGHWRKDPWDPEYSEDYSLALSRQFNKLKEPAKGAVFYDSAFYSNNQIIYAQEQYCLPVILSNNYFTPFNLSPAEIPQQWNKVQIENYLEKSPFHVFRKKLSRAERENLRLAQLKFIRTMKLNYLVFPQKTELGILDSLNIEKKFEDKTSGQIIAFLK